MSHINWAIVTTFAWTISGVVCAPFNLWALHNVWKALQAAKARNINGSIKRFLQMRKRDEVIAVYIQVVFVLLGVMFLIFPVSQPPRSERSSLQAFERGIFSVVLMSVQCLLVYNSIKKFFDRNAVLNAEEQHSAESHHLYDIEDTSHA